MDLFPFSDNSFDHFEYIINDSKEIIINNMRLNEILYECDDILRDETYYLDCLNFLFKKNIHYENEMNFDSIRLIRNIYQMYSELLMDDVSSVMDEINLFRTNLDKFFDLVRIERKKITIDTIIEMGCFLGDSCPYDDCDNFIFGERECCDVCKRGIRIDTDCDELSLSDLSSNYYLEGKLYYEKI